jgi:hypothetical protein
MDNLLLELLCKQLLPGFYAPLDSNTHASQAYVDSINSGLLSNARLS